MLDFLVRRVVADASVPLYAVGNGVAYMEA
jgi:hypothetical protein